MKTTADSLNIPLVNVNESRESLRSCLPSNVNLSQTEQELMYRDDTHPNRLGELTIATMIGRTIEQALRQYIPTDVESVTKGLLSLTDRTLSNYDAICFGRLECKDEEPQSIGTNRCLNVTRATGFELRRLLSEGGKTRKIWWEGAQPGNSIEFRLDTLCTEIIIFHNLRVTNGMVMIKIDGKTLDPSYQDMSKGKLPQGVLDGWYEGSWWLPRERGLLVEAVIARGLDPVPHEVRLEVLNTTNSENGSYKFDFRAIACKK